MGRWGWVFWLVHVVYADACGLDALSNELGVAGAPPVEVAFDRHERAFIAGNHARTAS